MACASWLRSGAAAAVLFSLAMSAAAQAPAGNPDGCLTAFDPDRDYFPEKVELDHAANFAVEYHASYKLVTVFQPSPGDPPERYVLVQCGAPAPALSGDFVGAEMVTVPVATIYSESSTHFPMLETIGVIDRLTGVSSGAYTTTEPVIAGVAAGTIVEFAPAFAIDLEKVIDGDPDLFMTGGYTGEDHRRLRAAGIPVVANAEWLEPEVLGRAEWVKYVALYFNREAEANSAFASIAAGYQAARDLADGVPASERPLVFTGAAAQGTFYAAGGQSYVAEMIADAGAVYVFADNPDTGSTPIADLETILDRAADADIWINAYSEYKTLADIVADDPRLAALPAAQAGQVWNYDLLQSPGGGVAYFELGVLRPDLVLADLVKIFHPALFADRSFTFYRPIRLE